jgi:hypothetical protein
MNVEIGAEAALFPEKEYINGIAVAVWLVTSRMGTGKSLTFWYNVGNSPKTDFDLQSTFLQDGILRHYISLGADRGKLVLGIPLYGQSFTMKG